MPTCRKCSADFPNRIKIDAVWRSLQRRKYCLSCSPLLGHNTKKLEAPPPSPHIPQILICGCGRKYPLITTKGHSQDRCNSCRMKSRREATKIRAIQYKGGSCVSCGYSRCAASLTFHHMDPSKKDFQISGNHTRSWITIQRELDKCVLLCRNCHGELHAGVLSISE